MTGYLLAVLGLGVAGLDPIGALLAVAALAAGARRVPVLGFAVAAGVVTVASGVLLSLLVGPRLVELVGSASSVADNVWLTLDLALGVLLLGWAWLRARRPAVQRRPSRGHLATGWWALLGAGVLFGLGAVSDPTFLAVVALAAREPLPLLLAGHLLWFLASQAPLISVSFALGLGRETALVSWIQAVTGRYRPGARRAITVLVLAIGTLLLVDAAAFVATGSFLLG